MYVDVICISYIFNIFCLYAVQISTETVTSVLWFNEFFPETDCLISEVQFSCDSAMIQMQPCCYEITHNVYVFLSVLLYVLVTSFL